MSFLSEGDFHIANFYTINHNTPNVITFTPREEGTIKIFIQSPEDITDFEESIEYEVEIVIYDPSEEQIITRAINAKVDFTNKDIKGEMDYTYHTLDIKREHVNRTLLIVF